jgi:hypothetical protein
LELFASIFLFSFELFVKAVVYDYTSSLEEACEEESSSFSSLSSSSSHSSYSSSSSSLDSYFSGFLTYENSSKSFISRRI